MENGRPENTRRRERTRGDDAASSSRGDRGPSRDRDRGATETRARARASDAGEEEPRRCPAGFALSDASLRRRRSALCFRWSRGGSGPRKSAGPRQTFPTSLRRSRLSSHFDQTKSFSGFRRLFDAGKKCTVTPCHAATPRRFTIFCVSVSRTLSWRFCSLVFGSGRSDVHRPPLSHSHHTTFHTKRNNGCFRRYHPLPQGASPRTWAAAWRRAGPDAPRPVPIGAIALRNTREKKPYPLRSRPGTRARGRERRHDAETNVTARRALTFCPVDAITG